MFVAATLVALLADPVSTPTDWIGEEGGVLELKLAHEEPQRIDGGVLRVDSIRRLVRWDGIPGELGCRERVEASFEEVKAVRAARGAGFTLELRGGRKMTFLPLPHAGWFAKQATVRQGDFAHIAREAGLEMAGGEALPLSGSAASTAPSLERVELPDEVRFDVRRAVEVVREALGRAPAPGAKLREALHGPPEDVSIADLTEAPAGFAGRTVRVRGVLVPAREPSRPHRLTEDDGSLSVAPAPEIAAVVSSGIASWAGQELEVTGVYRRETFSGREQFSLVFWDFAAPEKPAPVEGAVTATTLAALAAGNSAAPGRVRVVGCFRGRNLYGDLPTAGRRGSSDWVIKDGPHAAWVSGKRPRGEGWSLGLDAAEATRNWVEVVGRAELRDGVVRLRADSVSLVKTPARASVRPGRRLNVTRGIPPVVVFALPLDGDAVSPNGRLIVQFNKYMDGDTFQGRVRLRYADGGGELPAVKVAYDDARRALIIDPGDRLQVGRTVECVLLPGIADADGILLTPRFAHDRPGGAVEVFRYDVGL